MRYIIALTCFMIAAPASAAPIPAAQQAELTRFFRAIYSTFDPGMDGKTSSRILADAALYTPDTLALIRTARRLANGDQIGPGYNLFCHCQDYDKVTFTGASYRPASAPSLVNATVTVNFAMGESRGPKSYTFLMQRTPAGWRIHDIALMGGASYRAELIAENRRHAAPARSVAPATATAPKKVVISANDIALAAKSLGFTVRAGKVFNDCDAEVLAVHRQDLNSDGVPELIFQDGICNGGDSGWIGVASRASSGAWRSILQHQGEFDVLATRHGGWADLRLYIRGMNPPPVFRWSGKGYVLSP